MRIYANMLKLQLEQCGQVQMCCGQLAGRNGGPCWVRLEAIFMEGVFKQSPGQKG